MKRILRILVLMTVVSLFAATKSRAQLSIRVQLNRPPQYEANERDHPHRPSPNHIWVHEEWVQQGNQYVYQPGYWALPPKIDWNPGHWVQQNGGNVWVPGHWIVYINGQWTNLKY